MDKKRIFPYQNSQFEQEGFKVKIDDGLMDPPLHSVWALRGRRDNGKEDHDTVIQRSTSSQETESVRVERQREIEMKARMTTFFTAIWEPDPKCIEEQIQGNHLCNDEDEDEDEEIHSMRKGDDMKNT